MDAQAQADTLDLEAYEALSQRERALRGLAFHGDLDDQLTEDRVKARELCFAYNHHPWQPYFPGYTFADQFGPESRQQHLADLFHLPLERVKQLALEPPIAFDYGYNTTFKGEFYANTGCVFLDGAAITFGERVVLAPGVHIYCGTHSVDVEERRAAYDRAYPVTVGDDVWIGGGAKILGGTVIGDGCTVAAGAVVKGTFPPNSIIAGVPARVIRTLDPPAPFNRKTGEGVAKPDDERLRRPLRGMEGRTAVPLEGAEKA
ncbi:hypothetical protein JCM8208_005199 [Rhodotorula glutinis]